ncbi:MAG TPA: DUF5700 domain-containing putative Zn-dependent protease [Gemmatimonadales bacterium]
MRAWLHLSLHLLVLTRAPSPGLTIVTDEADAALAILEHRAADRPVPPDAWTRLFQSEGYRRLKAREHSMGREFEDSGFREFMLSDTLLRRAPALRRALRDWKVARLDEAARKALAYLPRGTPIRARVYLLIKPKTNSFVFEAATDPAIMLYLDPTRTRAQLENSVAHELHHIGYAAACHSTPDAVADSAVSTARQWLGAFGEGVAMLAAAGGPEIHPHATSSSEDRARWDRDVADAPADLRRVESFLRDVVDRRVVDPDSIGRAAMEFFGVQGPWYTLGWLMARTVERAAGRAALVGLLCDPVSLLKAYDAAARDEGGRLPLWSDALIRRLTPAPRARPPRRGGPRR